MNKRELKKLIDEGKFVDLVAELTPVSKPFTDADAAYSYLSKVLTIPAKQESFYVVTLDGAHKPIKALEVTKGLVNRTLVHPREIFRDAILDSAISILVAHNHPSGTLEPSTEDKEITRKLKQAGEIIGIDVLDHLIVDSSGRSKGYYSFAEHGII